MGVTLATVTNINDPENLGRVRCKFVTKNNEASELQCGFYFMPNVDDLVLVAFEDGDIHRPFIIGGLWGKLIEPPHKIKDGKNELYLIKTPNESIIELADKKGEEVITIKTPKGRKVELNDKAQQIALSDGNNSITLDGQSGEVKIKCKNKLTIEVGSGNTISIDGMGGTVKIAGQQSVDVDSVQVKITAKATATVKGNAQVTVEGGGMTSVKGGILKLN
jgi:uncharacterized protein involved in type VI secretion and phage assembly